MQANIRHSKRKLYLCSCCENPTSLMKNAILLIALLHFALVSCQPDGKQASHVEQIGAGGQISSIIRNPISANDAGDPSETAQIEFDEVEFNFGEVDEGAIIRHVFTFTNTGKAPLLIRSARSTCGCTVPDWPKNPIEPGGKGEISVQFNTQDKTERQEKPVTIIANTIPAETKVRLRGYVHPKNPQ
jgi:hypothetical protein